MIKTIASKFHRSLFGGMLFGIVLTAGVGCQTFSLSEEDFQRQQRGGTVDCETGQVVGVAGTAGYIGLGIYEILHGDKEGARESQRAVAK